jgi:hypothetical protein
MLVRTEMRWPAELKAAAEARAGKDGLTQYVLALVAADLAGDQPKPAPRVPAAVKPPSPAPRAETPRQATSSRACGSFKPRPGNALRCFTCGERYGDHA